MLNLKQIFFIHLFISHLNIPRFITCMTVFCFENEVAHYLTLGSIFVIGDFNSRTRLHDDFIQIDVLHHNRLCVYYANDTTMKSRVNPDAGHNEYGTRLLQLCKATGLRIVNGRHKDGDSNSYTYGGPRGSSVIDYLLLIICCLLMICFLLL